MLNIKTIKNLFITDPEKNGYCFRSTCSETLDLQNLVTEMVRYNSSFTEADVDGMLKGSKHGFEELSLQGLECGTSIRYIETDCNRNMCRYSGWIHTGSR